MTSHDAPTLARTALATAVALVAFAANSLLCRAALRSDAVDPATFTALRLISGAVALAPFLLRARRAGLAPPSWTSALALFGYAIGFSLAYTSISAGTGALLLFGAVQATMIGWGIVVGERPRPLEWAGLLVAAIGLLALLLPGATAPSPLGAALMLAAGAAWGAYSWKGRGQREPAAATAYSFLRASPMAVLALFVYGALSEVHAAPWGVVLAVASGAVTSGLGYVVWYVALRGHTSTSAAVVQLLVPVLAAGSGVVLLDEQLTLRLAAASALVIGGIALVVRARRVRA